MKLLICRCSLILCGLLALASCEPAKEETPPVEEKVVLTPEEEALNATLDNPDIFTPQPEEPDEPEEFVLNTSNKVSILGYHKFADTQSRDDMVISTKKFREQMQILKDAKIPVISMQEFLRWRAGEINIPDPCVIITMDDGWLSVYSHAMPILKEFGYPFSVYIYKNYVNLGGQSKSLTYEQIAEIRKNGGEIGSHSVSHADLHGKKTSLSEEAYQKWLDSELGDSKAFIKENVGVDPDVFAYPYGKYNQQVVDTLHAKGYKAGLTVNGSKVGFTTPLGELGRFIIHGNNDRNFQIATSFGRPGIASGNNLLAEPEPAAYPTPPSDPATPPPPAKEKLVSVSPEEGATIADRTPLITVDLSKLGEFDSSSLSMKISGFGTVPHIYDPQRRLISYQIPQTLRSPDCQVSVSLKRPGKTKSDAIVWRFLINRQALYLLHEPDPENEASPAS